jgi:signal transduction histidine kinase
MNQKLQNIFDIINQSEKPEVEKKDILLKALKDADKEFEILTFKLDRTEKVKRTTSILLEETIEELEHKRKAVEEQNRELEIESALERVRAVAMGMNKPEDLLKICEVSFNEFNKLGFNSIRNSLIHILDDSKQAFTDYDYSDFTGGEIVSIGYHSHPVVENYLTQLKKGDDAFIEVVIENEELEDWKKFLENKQHYDTRLNGITGLYYYLFSIGAGDIGLSTFSPINESQIKILKRFRNVFDLAYRRYTDIALAEIQAKEARIEMALEKVRSRTMAMQHSNELPEAANLLFLEVQALGIPAWSCGYNVLSEDKKTSDCWMSSEGAIQVPFNLYFTEEASFIEWYKFLQSSDSFFVQELGGNALQDHYNYMRTVPKLGEVLKSLEDAGISLPTYQINHLCKYTFGFLLFITYQPVPDAHDIFKRFTKVFEQTYTRFLDLQKAEAQARESRIETALEKVRARTMAMQKSEELKEVIQLVYHQFKHLNIHVDHTGFILDYRANTDMHIWLADKNDIPVELRLPYFDSPHWNSFNHAKESGLNLFTNHLDFEEKNKFYITLFKLIPEISPEVKNTYLTCPGLYISTVLLDNIALYIENFSGIPYSDEDNIILTRFGKVFQQTYTRFLDLQKAEAQARESRIETALERVRARTMAMRQSAELLDIVVIMRTEFVALGHEAHYFWHMRWLPDKYEKAMTSGDGTRIGMVMNLPRGFHEDQRMLNWETTKEPIGIFAYDPEGAIKYVDKMIQKGSFDLIDHNAPGPDDIRAIGGITFVMARTTHGEIGYSLPGMVTLPPAEALDTLVRFAGVFDLAYLRFEDLKKAELRNREAQIELALERTRTQSMLMQHSDELNQTIQVFHQQLEQLGIQTEFSYLWLPDEEKETHLFWTTWNEIKEGDPIYSNRKVTYPLNKTEPSIAACYTAWESGQKVDVNSVSHAEVENYFTTWDELLKGVEKFKPSLFQDGLYYVDAYMKYGCFGIVIRKLITDDEQKILYRFAVEFERTYTRFLDLQKAEAQAKEVIKQASLDRIRGEIASMRTSEDLNRITPVIWRELKSLEVPFFRCGVFIVDEVNESVQVYLTTPDGNSLGALLLSFNANELTSSTVDHWRNNKIYYQHWDKKQFITWTRSLIEQGHVNNMEKYQGSATPPESLNLHFVPFPQGMLYVGNTSPLTDDNLELVKTLAEAFSVAYSRYEDFKHLEEAKNKIEITLKELKSAQVQLIHSEKMASLGELTAGIAHEIKNPLNFVNNFSDLSRELIEEIKLELENKNSEEVLAILNDLSRNLEKINHHGKRADSIVKGMLLHSRGTSGEKTPTNINDLLDQYVNLAYHGMRAQNKDFNITIVKDYDNSLEKLNVIPQDLGRVFLNIINNACYAAFERKSKNGENNFSPTLFVSTKKNISKAEIRIGDNGNGIPSDIIDKIFQPFFTTKPSGEGTGLGLSLSYDIVTKLHEGELKVESKVGEGSAFELIFNI